MRHQWLNGASVVAIVVTIIATVIVNVNKYGACNFYRVGFK